MKQFMKSLLTDEQGAFSSKRLMGIIACLVIFTTSLSVMVFKDLNVPSDSLIDSITFIALGCLGLSSADKFSKK